MCSQERQARPLHRHIEKALKEKGKNISKKKKQNEQKTGELTKMM